ncbi:hypothetical protein CEXT_749761 [Caerostris extrusa]|uniref:Uncharacterized protein n=1 Tax=Caerostris extrusa TaxID=172846 RepID=A0AAV4TDI5_CAEEX|nr:hypothetical protein CEXT_749761 [Caerostris extrusa]
MLSSSKTSWKSRDLYPSTWSLMLPGVINIQKTSSGFNGCRRTSMSLATHKIYSDGEEEPKSPLLKGIYGLKKETAHKTLCKREEVPIRTDVNPQSFLVRDQLDQSAATSGFWLKHIDQGVEFSIPEPSEGMWGRISSLYRLADAR